MKVISNQQHIFHIIFSMIGAGFCIGIIGPFLEVFLYHLHFSDWYISIFALVEAGGFLFLAPFIPTLLRYFPHDLLLIIGLLFVGGVLIFVSFVSDIYWIIVLRFFMGLGKSLVFIVGATIVNLLATAQHRGFMIGFFAASFFGAEGLAPLLLSVIPYKPSIISFATVFCLLVSMIPLLLYRCQFTKCSGVLSIRHSKLLLSLPIVIVIAIMQSLNAAAFEESFALYAIEIGMEEETVMILNTILLMGGVFLCGFSSVLLDKYAAHKVVLGLMVVIVIAYVMIYMEAPVLYNSWVALFFLGGVTLSLYMVAMVILGHVYHGSRLAGAMAGFVIISTLSEIVALLFLGGGMSKWGASVFPLLMLSMNGLCIASYLWLFLYKKLAINYK